MIIALALPSAATATTANNPRPPAPSGLRVVKVSNTSFTVATQPAANAHKYRVFAATTRKALALTTIARTAKKSAFSRHPMMTIGHLPYRTTPYYYRVEAINGAKGRFSTTIGSVGLLPPAPTNLHSFSTSTGSYLTWKSGAATGFEIAQSTSSDMTENLTTYQTNGTDDVFAPTGLTPDTTYYFQVRALNGSTESAYTGTSRIVSTMAEQPVNVMTYNILESSDDGRDEGGQKVAPWSQRKPAAVALIRQADPDVIAVQEAAAYVGNSTTERQVDSLVDALGGDYSLAYTEIPPTQKHFFRTGVYILYKTGAYVPVGTGDHWGLGDNRWAAYQTLQNVQTGAQFLMVATHLAVGAGTAMDTTRKNETWTMVADARNYVGSSNLPIVYAGDLNSDGGAAHTFDGPAVAMKSVGMENTYDSAQTLTNAQYDSANDYLRVAPVHNEHIDGIYATPGVGVTSWNLILDLTDGQYVGVMPSDHNPLVSDLLIPYTPAPPVS
jgi:endonuclease/exonuclease/phosphatase family metal-dependent hydrolase